MGVYTDPSFEDKKTIYRTEALLRSSCISELNYDLALSLLKGGDVFHGQVTVSFNLSFTGHSITLDYKGKEVRSILVNGRQVKNQGVFRDHKIYLPK